MKIGIDATSALKFRGGVSRYTRNLIENIMKLDHNNQYLLYYRNVTGRGVHRFNLKNNDNFFECFNRMPHIVYENLKKIMRITPDCVLPNDVDVLHFPDNNGDLQKSFRKKVVTTVHDIFAFVCPQYVNKATFRLFSDNIENMLIRSDAVITISNNSKKDIVEHFDVDPKKIKVIHIGYDKAVFNILEPGLSRGAQKTFGMPHKYILNVGVISPRKNIINLIKAFEVIKQSFPEYKLFIVGQEGWGYEKVYSTWENSLFKKDIIFIGNVSDEKLANLYRGADIFIFPSYYEGFGLPIIESMACGAPVITSNVSSMPEVAGDAAMLVDPNSFEELAAIAAKVIGDRNLRQEMVVRGLKRAEIFSWEKTTMETLSVYSSFGNKL